MSEPASMRRIIWKEYRQQRGFWLVMAVTAVLWQLLARWAAMLENRDVSTGMLFGIAWGIPCFFALGCGATLFAGEHDQGTFGLLRSLPVRPVHVLAGKFMCAVAGLLSMPLLLWLSAYVLCRMAVPSPLMHAAIVLGGLVTSLELLAWGMFFSLQLQRPLWAVVLGCGTAVVSGSILMPPVTFYLFALGPFIDYDEYLVVLPLRTALALAVLAADVWLALGWLHEQPRTVLTPFRFRRLARVKPAAPVITVTSPRIWTRLLWQEWRQSRGLLAILGAVATLAMAGAVLANASHQDYWVVPLFVAPVITGVLGACVFLGDQSHNSFRFFAEHAISPRRVWLSRHVVWGGCSLLWIGISLAFIALLLFINGQTVEFERNWRAVLMLLLGSCVVSYTAAQVSSMYVRSGVVAWFVGIFLAALAVGWCALMWLLHVPLVWSAAPLPLMLLGATWVRAPDWILERTSLASVLRAGLSLGLPVLLVAAVISYRVFEILAAALPPLSQVNRPATDEERRTASLYEEAMHLAERVRRSPASTSLMPSPAPSDTLKESSLPSAVAVERDLVIATFLEASRQPVCRFQQRPADTEEVNSFQSLADLVLAAALEHDRNGDSEKALELYFALLRSARHHYQTGTSFHQVTGNWLERTTLDALVGWASHPGRSAEDVQKVIDRLNGEFFAYTPDRELVVLQDYHLVHQMLEGDAPVPSGLRAQIANHQLLLALMPWEKIRLRRVHRHYTSEALSALVKATWQLQNQRPFVPMDDRDEQFERQLNTTLVLPLIVYDPQLHAQVVFHQECVRRAARVRLAALRWRAEYGELPPSLELPKLGSYAGGVTVDPYTAKPFVYRPEGLGTHIARGEEELPPGTPFIWTSMGMLFHDPSRQVTDDWEHLGYFRQHRDGPRMYVGSQEELWRYGWLFRIPTHREQTALPQEKDAAEAGL